MATPAAALPVAAQAPRRAGLGGKTAAVAVRAAPATTTTTTMAGALAVPVMRRRNSRAGSSTAAGGAAKRNDVASPSGETTASVVEPASSGATQRRRRKGRVTVDISSCRYAIIRKCLRERDFRLVKRSASEAGGGGGGAALLPAKWDIWWSDRGDLLRDLPRLSPFQKVNHFPSMEEICRKDFLANNLNAIYKVLPREFQFFPRTFLIPAEKVDLQSAMEAGSKNATYIVKPRTLCQGKGISLIQSFAKLPVNEPCVVQRYIDNPLLIDGLKFDLRIYVLVHSVRPLKIYAFRNGLARFCTTPFQKPTKTNLVKKRMHLTNYAINKRSKDFQQATAGGDSQASKRSLASVMKYLDDSGRCSSSDVWSQICDIVVKTLLCIEPKLQSSYKSYFWSSEAAEAQWGPKCFEILGFDVMLDAMGKVWLFEVNHAPSFAGDSPLDREIKSALISATLDLVGVTNEKKRQYVRQQRAEWTKRLWAASQPTAKPSLGERDDNQAANTAEGCASEQTTTSEKKTTAEGDSEDTDENGPESEDCDDAGDDVGANNPSIGSANGPGDNRESVKLTNVLLRRNRVVPAAAETAATTCEFGNEFTLVYSGGATSDSMPNTAVRSDASPRLQTYERVRDAAQVNRSKLWT